MALFQLLFSSLGLLIFSISLALILRQNSHPARFILATLSGWIVLSYLTLLACGLLHVLRSDVVTAISLLLGMLFGWWTKKLWLQLILNSIRKASPVEERQSNSFFTFSSGITGFLTLAFMLFLLHWLREAITGPTRLSYDDLWYHIYYPTLWLKNQEIEWVPPDRLFAWQIFFPYASELTTSWFALPFQGYSRGHSLAWASLTSWIYILMILSSITDITRRVTVSSYAWMLPCLICLSSGSLLKLGEQYSDTDLALPACLLAAFCFALPLTDCEEIASVWQDGIYVACLLGISTAIKMSSIISLPVISLVWLLRLTIALKSNSKNHLLWRQRTRVLLLGCGMLLISGFLISGYWYLRNLWITGNPLFPAEVLGLSGMSFERTTLREFFSEYGARVGLDEVYRVYLNWPHFHGTLVVASFFFQILYLIIYRRKLSFSSWIITSSTLILAGTLVFSISGMPYSAGTTVTFDSGQLHYYSFRYIGLVPILGWMAWGWLVDLGSNYGWRNETALLISVFCIATGNVLPGPFSSTTFLLITLWLISLSLVAVARTQLGSYAYLMWERNGNRIILACIVALAFLTSSFITLYHKRKAVASESFLKDHDQFGSLVQELEKLPDGEAVTIYGTRFHYLLFGEHGQFDPIKLNSKGQRARDWRDALFDSEQPTKATWCEAVGKSRVGVIVFLRQKTTGGALKPWTQEYHWVRSCPRAELKFEDEYSSIWYLKPAGE